MEEKNFTDEEIAKAILQQVEYGAGIPYIDEWKKVRTIKFTEILDFIHRLQGENAELKEDNENWETMFHICEERKYRKMFNEEWKKEYQKELDKQGEGLIAGSPDFDYVYQRYFEQKAEIERLTEENKHLDKLLGEKRLDELTVARQIVAQNCVLNEENAELQKQVDELKSRKIEPLIVKCPSLETCPKVEQAVKDTAKEIIAFVEDKDKKAGKFSIYRNLLCELKERYGVEVE